MVSLFKFHGFKRLQPRWLTVFFKQLPQDCVFWLGIALILITGLSSAVVLSGFSPVNFVDTKGYNEIKEMISRGDLLATRFAYRPQSFSFLWYLSEQLHMPFGKFMGTVTALSASILFAAAYYYNRIAGWALLVFIPIYLTSKDHLSWSTCLLTESVQFGALALVTSAIITLEYNQKRQVFSKKSGILRCSLIPASFLVVSIAFLHSLKPWLVPIVYLAVRVVLYCVSGIMIRIINVPGNIRSISILPLVLSIAVGSLVAKATYISSFARGPGNANAVAFMERERSDVFVKRRIEQKLGNADQLQELVELEQVIGPGIAACVGKQWSCDLSWAGISGSPWESGSNKRPVELIKTIYLKDLVGIKEITKIAFNRLFMNLTESQSLSTYYGHAIGNDLLPKIGSLAIFFVFFLFLVSGFYLFMIAAIYLIPQLRESMGTRTRDVLLFLGEAEQQVTASLGITGLTLFGFLAITGGFETARTEAAAVYLIMIFCCFALSSIVSFHRKMKS